MQKKAKSGSASVVRPTKTCRFRRSHFQPTPRCLALVSVMPCAFTLLKHFAWNVCCQHRVASTAAPTNWPSVCQRKALLAIQMRPLRNARLSSKRRKCWPPWLSDTWKAMTLRYWRKYPQTHPISRRSAVANQNRMPAAAMASQNRTKTSTIWRRKSRNSSSIASCRWTCWICSRRSPFSTNSICTPHRRWWNRRASVATSKVIVCRCTKSFFSIAANQWRTVQNTSPASSCISTNCAGEKQSIWIMPFNDWSASPVMHADRQRPKGRRQRRTQMDVPTARSCRRLNQRQRPTTKSPSHQPLPSNSPHKSNMWPFVRANFPTSLLRAPRIAFWYGICWRCDWSRHWNCPSIVSLSICTLVSSAHSQRPMSCLCFCQTHRYRCTNGPICRRFWVPRGFRDDTQNHIRWLLIGRPSQNCICSVRIRCVFFFVALHNQFANCIQLTLTLDVSFCIILYNFVSFVVQELLRLVSSKDMESLNAHAAYLSESLQPIPYTPFAALMARQTNNESATAAAAVQDTRSTEAHTIGLLGKASVKEVIEKISKKYIHKYIATYCLLPAIHSFHSAIRCARLLEH